MAKVYNISCSALFCWKIQEPGIHVNATQTLCFYIIADKLHNIWHQHTLMTLAPQQDNVCLHTNYTALELPKECDKEL